MSSVEILKDFDVVGSYSQDEVNGFSNDVIPTLVNAVINFNPKSVLDCMAGDGNLALRCLQGYSEKGIDQPEMDVLEFSRIQSEIARSRLASFGVNVWTGDVLEMKTHEGLRLFSDNQFDCIMIKSANHEIPLKLQPILYAQIFRILKPGGLFINLGFAFEDEKARDEVRQLALCKDSLAGLLGAATNRHFLMRSEFYKLLKAAGFTNIEPIKTFIYDISADRVGKNYFPTEPEKYQAFKNAVLGSSYLQQSGSIKYSGNDVAFLSRGEITASFKPNRVN